MFSKKCKLKQALEADRYVRGEMSKREQKAYEQRLKLSSELRREVRFARQLFLYYQKPNDAF